MNTHTAPRITLVAAMADNRVIGHDNDLPWSLPDDMRHFVALTRGKPIVMGRKNYESIGRALPKRLNIVLTRDKAFKAEGCTIVHSTETALAAAGSADEIMIIGGAEIYAAFLPIADRIELTRVRASIEGDTFFPEFSGLNANTDVNNSSPTWRCANRRHHPIDIDHAYAMDFETWVRD